LICRSEKDPWSAVVPFPSRPGRTILIGAGELTLTESDLGEAISTETL
jgi:hypothetical protein